MTHDEIMKLGERELYEGVRKFLGWGTQSEFTIADIYYQLQLCYQAEEKIKEMGLDQQYAHILDELSDAEIWDNFVLIHAHPIQRAQSILMTIEDTKGGG